MTRILLSVDLSNQVYRACAAHPQLSSRRVFTGGVYGFFVSWAAMMRQTRATHVAFCRDARPYLRAQEFPEYKAQRAKRSDPELRERAQASIEIILKILEDCGLQTWSVPGFEADDLGAHLALRYGPRFDAVIAASNDSDLYQLLGEPGFAIYSSKEKLVTLADLKARGLTPQTYMLMTALMGTHNGVPGIDRVGEKTAFRAATGDAPDVLRRLQDEHGEVIKRNLALIQLPHPRFPRGARMPQHGNTFDPRALYRALGFYDIAVTGGMMSAFEQILQRRDA